MNGQVRIVKSVRSQDVVVGTEDYPVRTDRVLQIEPSSHFGRVSLSKV